MRRRWLWIPLIIFGSCTAIVAPNLITAMARSKQKRTLADIRTVSTALEAYIADHPEWKPIRSGGSAARLTKLLQPKYVKHLPTKDDWEHPLGVSLKTITKDHETSVAYTIWSPGRDGRRDPKWGNPGYSTNFDNDIVFTDGSFTQYPEGL
jgi:type II secretory pathway pseudopilin PulG